MKTPNRKLAVSVFMMIAFYDAVVLIMAALFPHIPAKLQLYSWWSVNFPGLPFFHLLAGHVPHGLPVALLLIGIGIFSAFLWSAIAGYVFRRSHVA